MLMARSWSSGWMNSSERCPTISDVVPAEHRGHGRLDVGDHGHVILPRARQPCRNRSDPGRTVRARLASNWVATTSTDEHPVFGRDVEEVQHRDRRPPRWRGRPSPERHPPTSHGPTPRSPRYRSAGCTKSRAERNDRDAVACERHRVRHVDEQSVTIDRGNQRVWILGQRGRAARIPRANCSICPAGRLMPH